MAPTIFIVPGIYEGPSAFDPLVKSLASLGYNDVVTTKLVSTGTSSKPGPGLTIVDDTAAIAKHLAAVVEEAGPKGVVAVLHSAGGFLGSGAMKGLTKRERQEAGKEGGVCKIVFLAAGIVPEGTEHKPLPWMVFDEEKGTQMVADPEANMYQDLPPAEASSWASTLQPQPADWDTVISHCGWRDAPSVWIMPTDDKLIPVAVQTQMAQMAGSKVVQVEGGHMLQLSRADEVAKLVTAAVEGTL